MAIQGDFISKDEWNKSERNKTFNTDGKGLARSGPPSFINMSSSGDLRPFEPKINRNRSRKFKNSTKKNRPTRQTFDGKTSFETQDARKFANKVADQSYLHRPTYHTPSTVGVFRNGTARTAGDGAGVFTSFTTAVGSETVFPGRDRTAKYTGNWGLPHGVAREADAGLLFKRAGTFAFGGSGYKREALANSFGLITKRQKMSGNKFGYRLQAAGALYGVYDAFRNDEGLEGVVENSASQFGLSTGFRVGQSLGLGFARLGGATGFGLRAAGALAGGVLGVAAAVAVEQTVEGLYASTQSNNAVNRAADNLRFGDFKTRFTQSDINLTNRQRGLEQISKASLNNRGQILGSEASVLAGI